MKLRPATLDAAPKSVVVVLSEKLQLQLERIPAGTFLMGSPANELERGRDEQQHSVKISRPFYIGATLVTAAEYQTVTGGKTAHGREGSLPAEVAWRDAVRFCKALSKNTGHTFRLPAEAEWEYACRAGTTTAFNTGPLITTDQANFDGKFVYPGGQPGIYRHEPTPVRTFKPSAWGLYDMHGNAYQWCSDWYGKYPVGPAIDPVGPDSGADRVIRGGKYGSGPRYRSAARYSDSPNNSSVVFGFRVTGSRPERIKMKIGTTSFGFRYAFLDAARSPTLAEMIRQSQAAGVERLQICENVRPLEVSQADWREAVRCAADLGVELQLGCKTLKPATVERFINLAQELACDQLRIVTEEPDENLHGTRENVSRLLAAVVPKIQSAGLRLAIENHFDISSALLVELASEYPAELVGFCVDTANSLRSFEPAKEVLRLLQERAFCYHLKDYRVVGSMISFAVVGAPLGEGDLDLNGCLRSIFEKNPVPPLFVETWTPSENNRERDIALDTEWLQKSVMNLRSKFAKFSSASSLLPLR